MARSVSTADSTVQPVSVLSAVTATLTSLLVTGKPALASSLLDAIAKQPAQAAASSSSGLVRPVSDASARAFQVSEQAGAFSGLAMGLNALLTALLVPLLIPLLKGWL